MAPSLRRPRPSSADSSNSNRNISQPMDNTDNNNESMLEKKLMTLSSLEAQREEKRRRMEVVFQQVSILQMEMKELELELCDMDQDIEQLEEEIQKSAANAATSSSSNNNNTLLKMENAATTQTQTQMDEILTDPAAATAASEAATPPPSSSSSTRMMTMMTSIPSQEQLTEPTDHSPAVPIMTMKNMRRPQSASASLLQQQNHPLSSLSSTTTKSVIKPQLQLTTTTTTTTTSSAAAAATSRKKPPPPPAAAAAAASSVSASSSYKQQQPQALATTTVSLQQLQQQPAAAAAASAASAAVSSSSPFSHDQFPWSQQVHDLLHHTFRIAAFRDYQKEIINATLSGRDVFVLMRTGGGKSLTYQLPALLEGGRGGRGGRFMSNNNNKKVTLVVSPLLSLIQDQEEQMNAIMPGSALSFTSGLKGGNTEQARRWNLVRDATAGVCLIFVTPEKVHKSNKLRNELQKLHDSHRLGRFVIDEAHCASQWGSDFRPDYAQLGILKRHFPTIPVLAVTATASQRVRNDVCRILGLCSSTTTSTTSGNSGSGGGTAVSTVGRPYCFFRSSAHRPNLTYAVRSKDAVITDMVAFIKQHHARNAGIVYTLSRKDANVVASKLCEYGVMARAYHSDVSPTQKQAIHASWMKNQTQVVVATIAFGLGINKPDVRFVIHHTMSKTLDGYYQESGRASRDGLPADCILYYSPKDVIRLRCMVHEQQNGEENLWPMVRYAMAHGNDAVCKAIMLDNLGEPNAPNPTQVQRDNDGLTTETRDVGTHCQTVTRLLHEKCQVGDDLTMAMLVKKWRTKPDADTTLPCVQANPPAKDNLSVDDCERIIMALLVEQVFTFYVHWTAYQAVAYIRLGQRGHALLQSTQPKILVRFPIKEQQSTKVTAAAVAELAARKAVATSGEWLQVKPKAKRKKPSTAANKKIKATTNSKRAKIAKKQPKTTTRKKTKSTTTKAAAAAAAAAATAKKKPLHQQKLTDTNHHSSEVIELSSDDDDDDNDDDDNDDETVENDHHHQQDDGDDDDGDHVPAKKRARGSNTTLAAVAATATAAKSDDLLWDDESSASEFEFTD